MCWLLRKRIAATLEKKHTTQYHVIAWNYPVCAWKYHVSFTFLIVSRYDVRVRPESFNSRVAAKRFRSLSSLFFVKYAWTACREHDVHVNGTAQCSSWYWLYVVPIRQKSKTFVTLPRYCSISTFLGLNCNLLCFIQGNDLQKHMSKD